MKKWALILIFVLGVSIAFVATKYYTFKPSHPHLGRLSNAASCTVSCCLPEDISLTPVQEKQIQKLQQDFCQCRDTLSLNIDRKRFMLAEILLQPNPDSRAIETLVENIARLQADMEKQTIKHILEVKSLLPPEQQDRFIKPILHEIQRRCQHEEVVKNSR
jgi:hypothetical protein